MIVPLNEIPLDLSLPADFCPYALLPRDIFNEITNTTESFSSWHNCMNNTGCKWVAIIGIILASLFVFWILGAIVRCLCFGIEIFSACCCLCASCCSCCAPKRRQQQQPEYYGRNAPPMPMGPPSYQQQPVVVHNHFDRSLNDDEYGSGGPGYRGFSGNLPPHKVETAWERHNPDGTTEITTEPPPPVPSAAPVGFFGPNRGGYSKLEDPKQYGDFGNSDNAIEMSPFPLGEHSAAGYNQNTPSASQNPFQSPAELSNRGETPSQRADAYYGVAEYKPPSYEY